MLRYELIDHTADIGMRVFGTTLAELFENAGVALFELIADITTVSVRHYRSMSLSRDTPEELLVEWLNELLFIYDTEQLLFSSFSVKLFDSTSLAARVGGDVYQEGRHRIKKSVKAATYHNLTLTCCNGIWQATVVFDV